MYPLTSKLEAASFKGCTVDLGILRAVEDAPVSSKCRPKEAAVLYCIPRKYWKARALSTHFDVLILKIHTSKEVAPELGRSYRQSLLFSYSQI